MSQAKLATDRLDAFFDEGIGTGLIDTFGRAVGEVRKKIGL